VVNNIENSTVAIVVYGPHRTRFHPAGPVFDGCLIHDWKFYKRRASAEPIYSLVMLMAFMAARVFRTLFSHTPWDVHPWSVSNLLSDAASPDSPVSKVGAGILFKIRRCTSRVWMG
jgi:hypothetical protein